MIRPWYRSLVLWLGLPGLFFLSWAWRDSQLFYSSIWRVQQTRDLALLNWGGGVAILGTEIRSQSEVTFVLIGEGTFSLRDMVIPSRPPPTARWVTSRKALPAERYYRGDAHGPLPARRSQTYPSGSTVWMVFLPHWLLIACYLVAWMGTLILWQRRKARLLKAIILETL